jgi:hypothetical protein
MAFAKRLFFIVLFLSILTEATTTYKDPWSGGFSWYFHADLQSWLPQTHVPFNPFEITIMVILLAWALRGRRDRRFHFERGLLFWPVVVFGALLFISLLWGATQPGNNLTVGLEEIRALVYAILAYFLVGILFTHRRDLDTLTWVILISTLLMGIECIIRYEFLLPGHAVGDLDYDHEDATLLACAIILSIAMLLLGSTRRQKWFVIATLPIDLLGLMVTYRRAGEAALVTGLVFLAVILLRVNRSLFLKIVPITALLLSIYVAAEWNCTSGSLCQPARAISSQFNPDPRDAASNFYRLVERYDIILNIQSHPITGLGFGQQFNFYIPLPDLSFWPYWHYTPHDEILWIWMKMGIIGFIAFWWLIASALYRSGRLTQALSAAGDYKARALLAAAACLIIMQMTVSYVDLGLTSDRVMLVLGIMLGVIGHLPGILRRSTNTDIPIHSTWAVNTRIASTLDKETPEVQVGVLAHVLITPDESASPSQRDLWSQHRNTLKRPEARWNQSSGAPRAKNASRPISGAEQPHISRPLSRSGSATQGFSGSPDDELPWTKHSEE